MRICLMALLTLLVSGCSGSKIDAFPETFEQPQDLTDLDLDGVINQRDKCSNTLTGSIVDNQGCSGVKEIRERITLNIQFRNGSSFVNPSGFHEIKKVAEFLKEHPYTDVTIEGHASADGSAVLNKKLSQQRANSVALILTSRHGIKRSRIKAVGFGEEQLLDISNTPEAHMLNRRVVAEIRGTNRLTPKKWTIYSELDD